jgi:hypothetical protein
MGGGRLMELGAEQGKLLLDLIQMLGSNLTLLFFFLILSVIPWVTVFFLTTKLNKLATEIQKARLLQAHALEEIKAIILAESRFCKKEN